MMFRIYLRVSTADQNVNRAEDMLKQWVKDQHPMAVYMTYRENISGTTLERARLNRLLDEAQQGDYLLVESVDRLTRLSQQDFTKLKQRIAEKGLKLVVHDLPTTHASITADETTIAGSLIAPINNLLIDLLAVMAKLDNDKRKERIKQGIEQKRAAGWTPQGKQANKALHDKIRVALKERERTGLTIQQVAKLHDVSEPTVYRILRELKQSD
jgi:DNA invertase Pin-like site-specific DNA recombinase